MKKRFIASGPVLSLPLLKPATHSALTAIKKFCSAEPTCLGNIGNGPYEKHLWGIILIPARSKNCLKIFLFLAMVAILFSPEEPFGQFFVEDIIRNICVKLQEVPA